MMLLKPVSKTPVLSTTCLARSVIVPDVPAFTVLKLTVTALLAFCARVPVRPPAGEVITQVDGLGNAEPLLQPTTSSLNDAASVPVFVTVNGMVCSEFS